MQNFRKPRQRTFALHAYVDLPCAVWVGVNYSPKVKYNGSVWS